MNRLIKIDLSLEEQGKPYMAHWKRLACAGRAAEGLREGWRNQLRKARSEIGFEYLRFHGIFHDDMMVYREIPEDGGGTRVIYNWHYVDELFDFLLSIGIRPFLELGFMPSDLASGDATCFRWKGNITPPKDWDRWSELVRALVLHCRERYGAEDLRSWYFEVWNEPNLFEYFWHATQEDYFRLYRITARTIKAIDPKLRVGGPATSNFTHGEGPWIRDFLAFCSAEDLPVDFISSHPYPNHWPIDPVTGKRRVAFRDQNATAQDCTWLKDTVAASAFPKAEIHLTEWNSSFLPWDATHDTAFMGAFIARNAALTLGLVHSLGFWTFTDVFEETGAGDGVFHGGFGLMNYRGIPKPSFHAYRFLSHLGPLLVDRKENYLLCRSEDAFQILVWNYSHFREDYFVPGQFDPKPTDPYEAFQEGMPMDLEIDPFLISSASKKTAHPIRYKMHRLDRYSGSALDAWKIMGSPEYPREEEYRYLMAASEPRVEMGTLQVGQKLIVRNIGVHTLMLVEIRKQEKSKNI